jgi:F0F1-type ATP synthase membrane subunit b/b'
LIDELNNRETQINTNLKSTKKDLKKFKNNKDLFESSLNKSKTEYENIYNSDIELKFKLKILINKILPDTVANLKELNYFLLIINTNSLLQGSLDSDFHSSDSVMSYNNTQELINSDLEEFIEVINEVADEQDIIDLDNYMRILEVAEVNDLVTRNEYLKNTITNFITLLNKIKEKAKVDLDSNENQLKIQNIKTILHEKEVDYRTVEEELIQYNQVLYIVKDKSYSIDKFIKESISMKFLSDDYCSSVLNKSEENINKM